MIDLRVLVAHASLLALLIFLLRLNAVIEILLQQLVLLLLDCLVDLEIVNLLPMLKLTNLECSVKEAARL